MAHSPSGGQIPPASPLFELAALYGIQLAYTDSYGRQQSASKEAVLAALRALGAPDTTLHEAILQRKAECNARPLEPVQVAWDGRLPTIELRLPQDSPLLAAGGCWEIHIELDGGGTILRTWQSSELETAGASEPSDLLTARLRLDLVLETGYHHLHLEAAGGGTSLVCSAEIISAPVQCYWPTDGVQRSWGVFLPLYALRSRRDWGVGDFATLKRLDRWLAGLGAAWTGTLPLLPAFLREPFEPSPYMPVSRMFWNELFIRPEMEPEFRHSEQLRRLVASAEWRAAREQLSRSDLVDYHAVMQLKRQALEPMAAQLDQEAGARSEQLRGYLSENARLTDYARFRAVQEQRGQPWSLWPEQMREGDLRPGDGDPAIERYHQYVQWVAERQLERIHDSARHKSLYLDFPLGVHPDGYDVWRHRKLFALGAAAGAPPDDLFPNGQNWGFPPLHPDALRQDGYRYFRDSLRHQMRHAGMLRMDHVMGLNRLYWIPQGIAKADGIYVHYRAEEMYAVLSAESHRARCIVVGENLGTVPEEVTRAIHRHRTLGMTVLQFSVPPYPEHAASPPASGNLACLNTHDAPSFAGFLTGRDIDDFERLVVFRPERAAEKRREREIIIDNLRRTLGVAAGDQPEQYHWLLAAALRWLAESPAEAVIVNLEDLWAETAPQNIPGTGEGTLHPNRNNWRRKARLALEQIQADPQLAELLRTLMSVRRL